MSDHKADRPHGSGRPRRPGGPGYSRDTRSGRAPRAGRPASDPARQAAYEAIAAVHRDDAYANLVLPQILRDMRLGGRDAAFAPGLRTGPRAPPAPPTPTSPPPPTRAGPPPTPPPRE